MTVSVHLVTWNNRTFIPTLRRSLEAQTRKPDRIIVVDNASTDGTLELLDTWPGIDVLRHTRNLGFARAHNQAIRLSKADAVVVLNPDVLLEPTCLEVLTQALDTTPQVASVCPKLLRFSLTADDLREPVYSDTIDAAGMLLRRSRQVLNRGEGSSDRGQFDQARDVFGAPGVLALYRRTVLDDVAVNGEYFDEDFFAYKEDVDLAWRCQLAGWRCRYVPAARAYHYRTLSHHRDRLAALVETRGRRSRMLRVLSYRNHLLMLLKNETVGTFLPHGFSITLYELQKLGYALLREWSTLTALPSLFRLLPRMLQKRRLIQRRRRRSTRELRRIIES
ncbi:MAG: glycosyltransferase family 2 protein [Candidatus Kerfeldbacteria bacterium]|nr:glycosyltransferase family 2 protein [Candidatus Kerfeldbacteria bacterium]